MINQIQFNEHETDWEFLFSVYLLGFSDCCFSDGLFLFLLNPCTAQVLGACSGTGSICHSIPKPLVAEGALAPSLGSADWPLSFSLVIWAVWGSFQDCASSKAKFSESD